MSSHSSSRYAKKRKHDLDHDTSREEGSSRSNGSKSSSHRSRRRESSGSPPAKGGGNEESLSIEETNKLRASLGLAPLEVDDGPKIEESENGDPNEKVITEDGMQFTHKAAESWTAKKTDQKIREKLATQSQKRKVQSKVMSSKGLADSDSEGEESVEAWIERERKKAEQKARELEEMENAIDNAALPSPAKKPRHAGGSRPKSKDALAGMTVGHSKSSFAIGEETILVLDDKDVLNDEGEEVLVNPTLMYNEQLKKNRDIREKKSGYNPYEDEEVDDFGNVKRKDMLSKYDEGLDGPNVREKFKLDERGGVDLAREERELKEKRDQYMANRKLVSLETAKYKVASEFFTEEEMVSFRKPKKKKDASKSRKKKALKTDEIEIQPEEETEAEKKAREERLRARRRDAGEDVGDEGESSRRTEATSMEVDKEEGEIDDETPVDEKRQSKFKSSMGASVNTSRMRSLLSRLNKQEESEEDDEDDFGPAADLNGVVIDDDGENELSKALDKARRLNVLQKQKEEEAVTNVNYAQEVLSRIKQEYDEDESMDVDAKDTGDYDGIVFDATSEYYKTIGSGYTVDDINEIKEEPPVSEDKEEEEEEQEHHRDKHRHSDSEEKRRKKEKKEKKRSKREKEDREKKHDKEERSSRKDRDGRDSKRDRSSKRDREDRDSRRDKESRESKRDKNDEEQKPRKPEYENVLGKERDVTKGVAGMLKLANEKGYLDSGSSKKTRGGTLHHLESKCNVRVEFKNDIDDKYLKKIERSGTSGPLRAFVEKRDYQPEVAITYTDSQGREMDPKSAFRSLSHKFHGKASGKKQVEKRMRQQDKKERLKKMNSFDTPLGTLAKQYKKQEQTQSHYIVLSGGSANAPLQKD